MAPTLFDLLKPFTELGLYEALSNSVCPPQAVAENSRAQYLYAYLNQLGAKTILVEANYVDGDYLDDFASYYVRCFQEYEKRCTRLHFFDIEVTPQLLSDALFGDSAVAERDRLKAAYLGFIVARPLPEAIVGRTVLKTYPSDSGRRNYTCIKEYPAHPFGLDLSVSSLAFQEQDTVLAACATVALWSSLHMAAELFHTAAPRPAAITQAATQFLTPSRPIPSHGLNPVQLSNAITKLGLEPEVLNVAAETPLVSLMYSYLSMRLPLVLGLRLEGGYHAVAVVGYSLRRTEARRTEVAPGSSSVPMVSSRIDEFYVHDDQTGPFARLQVMPHEVFEGVAYPITFQGSWRHPATGEPLKMYPFVAMIPIYNKIRITFMDLQRWVTRLNTVFAWFLRSLPTSLSFEWDIQLAETTRYKEAIRIDPTIDDDVKLRFLVAQHPRFLWRVGLLIDDRLAVDFLADATGIARAVPFHAAVWHDDRLRSAFRDLLDHHSLRPIFESTLTESFWRILRATSE